MVIYIFYKNHRGLKRLNYPYLLTLTGRKDDEILVAIQRSKRIIDDIPITTFVRERNVVGVEVEAGTTGYCGGDGGHGGRTYFRIENNCGLDFDIRRIGEYGDAGFEFVATGDWELESIVDGLKFIVDRKSVV